MRLIHTANILLDRSYAGVPLPPAVGNTCRARRREVLENIVQRAASWPADAVLIAGNAFEHNRIVPETLTFLRQTLAGAGVPVFIAPGPRDPFAHDSPYARMPWPDNVIIFDAPSWRGVALGEHPLTVHGFAAASMATPHTLPPLAPEPDGLHHIALAHGWSVPDGQSKPVHPLGGAIGYGALGTPPQARVIPPFPVWAAPPPEAAGFDEVEAGAYLEVEWTDDGVTVTPVACGRTRFTRLEVATNGLEDFMELEEALLTPPEMDTETVLEVSLRGPLPTAWMAELDRLRAALRERALHLRWLDETEPAEDWAARGLEDNVSGEFFHDVNGALADAEGPHAQHLRRARAHGWAAFGGVTLPSRTPAADTPVDEGLGGGPG